MNEDELLLQLENGGYEEAIQYFETGRKYDIVIDSMKDMFNKYNNKYASKKDTNKLRRSMWELNREKKKKKKTCPYCKKEMLISNYAKHFKSKAHISKYGVITNP